MFGWFWIVRIVAVAAMCFIVVCITYESIQRTETKEKFLTECIKTQKATDCADAWGKLR